MSTCESLEKPVTISIRWVFDVTMAKIGPWSITALLATLVLLFAFQGEAIIQQPLVIALLALPILIQVFSIRHSRTGSTVNLAKSTP